MSSLKDWRFVAAIAGGLFVGVCALVFLLWLVKSDPTAKLDPTTLCPTKSPPIGITAILIDTTDPISPIQRETVRGKLERLHSAMLRHEALQIYQVGITPGGIHTPVFNKCHPGLPQPLYESERRALKRRNEFIKSLDELFQKSLNSGEADNSPIIESLQAIGTLAFNRQELDDAPKKLVIVSDMLQNSPILSHYNSSFDYLSWYESLGAGAPIAHLLDVEVVILYLTGVNTRQGDKHIDFWTEYLNDQGANVDVASVTTIPR